MAIILAIAFLLSTLANWSQQAAYEQLKEEYDHLSIRNFGCELTRQRLIEQLWNTLPPDLVYVFEQLEGD